MQRSTRKLPFPPPCLSCHWLVEPKTVIAFPIESSLLWGLLQVPKPYTADYLEPTATLCHKFLLRNLSLFLASLVIDLQNLKQWWPLLLKDLWYEVWHKSWAICCWKLGTDKKMIPWHKAVTPSVDLFCIAKALFPHETDKAGCSNPTKVQWFGGWGIMLSP